MKRGSTEMEGLPDAVLRLASGRGEQAAFLDRHHIEAASRLARLFEKARLRQRVTMSYDPARVGGRSGSGSAETDLSVSAADARRKLSDLARTMPAECWSLLFDICGLDLGLQEIEASRDWPRRGGKLVLRIALSSLASQFGLEAKAEGRDATPQRHWLPERPEMFPHAGS